jgi:hypothetical protein
MHRRTDSLRQPHETGAFRPSKLRWRLMSKYAEMVDVTKKFLGNSRATSALSDSSKFLSIWPSRITLVVEWSPSTEFEPVTLNGCTPLDRCSGYSGEDFGCMLRRVASITTVAFVTWVNFVRPAIRKRWIELHGLQIRAVSVSRLRFILIWNWVS